MHSAASPDVFLSDAVSTLHGFFFFSPSPVKLSWEDVYMLNCRRTMDEKYQFCCSLWTNLHFFHLSQTGSQIETRRIRRKKQWIAFCKTGARCQGYTWQKQQKKQQNYKTIWKTYLSLQIYLESNLLSVLKGIIYRVMYCAQSLPSSSKISSTFLSVKVGDWALWGWLHGLNIFWT